LVLEPASGDRLTVRARRFGEEWTALPPPTSGGGAVGVRALPDAGTAPYLVDVSGAARVCRPGGA